MTEDDKVEVKKLISEHSASLSARLESQEKKLDTLLNRDPWWYFLIDETHNFYWAALARAVLFGTGVYYLVLTPLFG